MKHKRRVRLNGLRATAARRRRAGLLGDEKSHRLHDGGFNASDVGSDDPLAESEDSSAPLRRSATTATERHHSARRNEALMAQNSQRSAASARRTAASSKTLRAK